MRYKPERALTQDLFLKYQGFLQFPVEMRYKPERALTQKDLPEAFTKYVFVEMRDKPERALTLHRNPPQGKTPYCRNEV